MVSASSSKVLGLSLVPVFSSEKFLPAVGKIDPNVSVLKVKVMISQGKLSPVFVTSPKIREVLLQNKSNLEKEFLGKKEFGYIDFNYNKKSKELEYRLFFPYPNDLYYKKVNGKSYDTHPTRSFLSKGIASFIETRALDMALSHFPDTVSVSFYSPSPYMKARLKKIRIPHSVKTPIEIYRAKLRKKQADSIRKARAKRRLK